MTNHWHLLLWPECDGELTAFMQRLTITHVRRWQEHRGYAGLGHVYQGRLKAFSTMFKSAPRGGTNKGGGLTRYTTRISSLPTSTCLTSERMISRRSCQLAPVKPA